MIDYLERIFAPARRAEEEADGPVPARAGVESEAVEFRSPPIPAGEEVGEVSTKTVSDVEIPAYIRPFLPGETPESMKIPAREEHSDPFERETVWMASRRPQTGRVGEELERRLRRDSRRYDSGFYRY